MNTQIKAIANDLSAIADDVRALMSATADMAGDQIANARKRVATALGQAEDNAMEQVRCTATTLREHPFQSVGIAFGVGVLIGCFAGRR